MAQEDDAKLKNKLYDYHLALVANSGLTEDSFKSVQESARNTFEEIIGTIRPWEGRSADQRAQTDRDQFRDTFLELGGPDIDDEKAMEEYWKERNKVQAEGEEIRLGEAAEKAAAPARLVAGRKRVEARRAKASGRRK
jgi:hypothetical protein|tara:strand:- start:26391 stop:26804 length:414 start_codon:yes stop_codon:yes gene_type:complete